MKTPIVLLSVLVAGLTAALVVQTIQLQSRNQTIRDLSSKLDQAESMNRGLARQKEIPETEFFTRSENIQLSRKAKSKKFKITCRYCKGEGKHILGYKGQLDPEVYGCSVCRGKGHTMLTIQTQTEQICEACKGIGSLGKKEWDGLKRTDVWTAQICSTCFGVGKTGKASNE